MTEFIDFDNTAANNTGAATDGYFAEGMDYFEVNNAAREFQAILSRWYDDTNGSKDTTGSANAYVLAAAQTITAYARGQVFWFEANFSNTGAATLNVDSVGAVSIVSIDGSALVTDNIVAGGVYQVVHDGTNFQLLNGPNITINGLTADTAVGATDTFPFYDGANKKITYANIVTDLEATVDHDNLVGFVADEHVAHSGVTITAGAGMTGGGTIDATRTLNVIGGNGITVNADDVDLDISTLSAMTAAPVGTDEFLYNDAGTMKTMSYNESAIPVNSDGNTHTFASTDVGTARVYTGATSTDAWTMDNSVGQIGCAILVVNNGTSAGPTITAGTATVESSSGNFVVKQEGMAILFQVATNVWKLSGDLQA